MAPNQIYFGGSFSQGESQFTMHLSLSFHAKMDFLTTYLHIKTHFNITNVAIGNLYELEELLRNLKILSKCAVKCTI